MTTSSAVGPVAAAAGSPPPTTWAQHELEALRAAALAEAGAGAAPPLAYDAPFSAFNPTPGTGRTGFLPAPPNNYPFYAEAARYTPALQPDGGQLSEWRPMYAPTKEQADADREAAFAAGVPHGSKAAASGGAGGEGGANAATKLRLTVVSELHDASEYGATVGADGRHSGGAFEIEVAPETRVEELRRVIRDVGGIPPALQRLAFAGKRLDDAQRTLAHYGLDYWHAKFPRWPLVVRRH